MFPTQEEAEAARLLLQRREKRAVRHRSAEVVVSDEIKRLEAELALLRKLASPE